MGSRLAKRQSKPVFLIEHGTDHFTVNNKFLDVFGKYYEHILTSVVKSYVDKFYGVSENCNKWLTHFNIRASGVFYNAINIADRNSVVDLYDKKYPKQQLVVTYAGRLIKEKGVLNLLEAFLKVKKVYPNAKLVVAGDGDLAGYIKKKYKDSSIDIVGRLDFKHVMALYKRTDIFVYPSLYPEGLPTSILEAGLMDCAIIATPKGGTEEVIPDRQHGIIIDGSEPSLVDAISLFAADEKTRQASASAVKERIEKNFDWDVVAAKVEDEIYKCTRG
jgi:glycosyltransferase involved in cell wall biosynthesis